MKIRNYAKLVRFQICGKLTYMGKYNLSNRFWIDEAKNLFLIDTTHGDVQIIPHR